jgi:hypothetical protein
MNTEKIGKLLKMLSSNSDGEVIAAARAILRTLAQEGADIHELAERVEGRKLSEAEMQRIYDKAFAAGKKSVAATADFGDVTDGTSSPSFHEMACEIMSKENGRLSPKERGFAEDMVRWCARREPSEKQGKWLHAIYCRIGRRR